ncbi:MAG: hypothetical protein WEB04_07885 [Dehalococcoidia bacterium]
MAERLTSTAGGLRSSTSDSSLLRARRWAVGHRDAIFVGVAMSACLVLSVAVYWPGVNGFFAFDDYFFLRAVRNHSFLGGMVRAFTFTRGEPFDEASPFWRPLIDIYFYAFKPFGLHAQPFHAVNIGLHGAVGALAVLLMWRLTKSSIVAAAIGLLFVVAPTYDFAVSWVAQVSELFGYALMLAALLCYTKYLTDRVHRPGYAAATFVLTFFALLTKESTMILAVLLPAVLVAIPAADIHRTRRQLLSSLSAPITMIVAFGVAMELAELLVPQRLNSIGWHMPRNLWRYLEWLVLPYRPGDFLHAREVLAALFLLAGTFSVLQRQRVLGFLFVWTIAALAPFTGFDEWIELRYTYLAALPFVAFVVLGAATLARQAPRSMQMTAFAALAAAFLLALAVTPMRTRDQQSWFALQGQANEQMIDSVRSLCGPLPRDSFVYVVRPPYFDLYGQHTPAAINLYYDHVNAAVVEDVPALAAFITNKCVLQYDYSARRYVRLE